MKLFKLSFLFICFLCVSLVITLPASFVVKHVTLDQQLKRGEMQGTWWSFHVDWLNYRGVSLKDIQFTLNPRCLFTGTICYQARNDQVFIEYAYSVLDKSSIITKSHASFSFSELSPLLNQLIVKPSGSLDITIETLKIKQNTLEDLKAKVQWNNVDVEGENFDLGAIVATIVHQPNTISINLSDNSDKMDLSGSVKIANSGKIINKIQLKTLDRFPEAIKTLLQGALKKRGNNVYEYSKIINNRAIRNTTLKF